MINDLAFGEIAAIIIFFIGVYGVVARRNIIKTVISIGIMETAVILYFISDSININKAPILDDTRIVDNIADPVPQALMITAIVIGIGITAVALTMFINLYHKYGTTNWKKAKLARDTKTNDDLHSN